MGLAPRQWVILLTFYMSYLMFGACIFYHIEHNAETGRRAKELHDRIEINGRLLNKKIFHFYYDQVSVIFIAVREKKKKMILSSRWACI